MSSIQENPTIQFIDFVTKNLKEVYTSNSELSYDSLTMLMILKFEARSKNASLNSNKVKVSSKAEKRKGPSPGFRLFKRSLGDCLDTREINKQWQALSEADKDSFEGKATLEEQPVKAKKVQKVSIYSEQDKGALKSFILGSADVEGETYLDKRRRTVALWKEMSEDEKAEFYVETKVEPEAEVEVDA